MCTGSNNTEKRLEPGEKEPEKSTSVKLLLLFRWDKKRRGDRTAGFFEGLKRIFRGRIHQS